MGVDSRDVVENVLYYTLRYFTVLLGRWTRLFPWLPPGQDIDKRLAEIYYKWWCHFTDGGVDSVWCISGHMARRKMLNRLPQIHLKFSAHNQFPKSLNLPFCEIFSQLWVFCQFISSQYMCFLIAHVVTVLFSHRRQRNSSFTGTQLMLL